MVMDLQEISEKRTWKDVLMNTYGPIEPIESLNRSISFDAGVYCYSMELISDSKNNKLKITAIHRFLLIKYEKIFDEVIYGEKKFKINVNKFMEIIQFLLNENPVYSYNLLTGFYVNMNIIYFYVLSVENKTSYKYNWFYIILDEQKTLIDSLQIFNT